MQFTLVDLHHTCSQVVITEFGGPIATGHGANTGYSAGPEKAETYPAFLRCLAKTVNSRNLDYRRPLVQMSRIEASVIDKQEKTAEFLETFGFSSDGWISYPKYRHKIRYFWLTGWDFMHILQSEVNRVWPAGVVGGAPEILAGNFVSRWKKPDSVKDLRTTPVIVVEKAGYLE